MYQKILTPRVAPVITPEILASFGHFDCPEQYDQSSPPNVTADYQNVLDYIEAGTDHIEIVANFACMTEEVLLTLDFFPNTQDPRVFEQYQLSYAFSFTPWWYYGFPAKDSIWLVRRPVQVPAYTGPTCAVTAVSLATNVLSVTCNNSPVGSPAVAPIVDGDVVILNGTAEGNVSNPNLTSSTTPFLNGVPLTVLTSSSTGFTATFNNFYTLSSTVQPVPGSYSNNADTGTAQVWSNPCVVTYFDQNQVLNTWNTTNYSVAYDKICLAVGNWWPLTDRRQDCIQITYWAGDTSTPASVPSQLKQAVKFLANHLYNIRDIIAIENSTEIKKTLCSMLSSYRMGRLPV